MNYDSDSSDSSEKKPQVIPTELDNSEVLNLSSLEHPYARSKRQTELESHHALQNARKQFLHACG